MNSFGFNNLSSENPLAQYLKQYVSPQPEADSPQGNGSSVLYEINCQIDIDYIDIDKSGRTQIFICPNEKRIYTRRYNFSKKSPDYKEYIEEEETKLAQKDDTDATMTQIAEALNAVANKLESLHNEIQSLKNNEIETTEEKTEDTGRRANGQFKKKGEK